jgi:hypothetical protein
MNARPVRHALGGRTFDQAWRERRWRSWRGGLPRRVFRRRRSRRAKVVEIATVVVIIIDIVRLNVVAPVGWQAGELEQLLSRRQNPFP